MKRKIVRHVVSFDKLLQEREDLLVQLRQKKNSSIEQLPIDEEPIQEEETQPEREVPAAELPSQVPAKSSIVDDARKLQIKAGILRADLGLGSKCSYQQKSLLQRVIFSEQVLKDLEKQYLEHPTSAMIRTYTTTLNCYVSLLNKLGIEKKPEITDLKKYIQDNVLVTEDAK